MFDPNYGNQWKRKYSFLKLFLFIGVLFFMMLGVAVGIFFNLSGRNPFFERQISLGDKYLKEMDYENAELAYIEAIKIDEKQQEGYEKLARLYMKVEKWEEAEDILELGIKTAEETGELRKLVKKVEFKIEAFMRIS